MKDFINSEKTKLGQRIQNLRQLLNLTQPELAEVIGIAKGTLAAMESGKRFTGDYLLRVCYFFGMDLNTFTNFNDNISESQLKQHLEFFHTGNKKLLRLLDQSPTLVVVLEKIISESSFFDFPRSVSNVTEYLEAEYNLNYSSSVVSQALINEVKSSRLKRKKIDGRNYVYQAKKRSN